MSHIPRKSCDWLDGIKPSEGEHVSFVVVLGNLEVGKLVKDHGEWVFHYSDAFRRQNRVKPIVDFPYPERNYRSRQLWPFFLLRLPSTDQPSVKRFAQKHGVREWNETMLLKHFGRHSIANPFQLVPE